MDIYAKKGHKVVCQTLNAGYPSDMEVAAKHLRVNEMYTVDRTIVHQSSTDVFLEEIPNVRFNSVFFWDISDKRESGSTMSKDRHTPLTLKTTTDLVTGETYLMGEGLKHVATMTSDGSEKERSELIVKAVNSHEELVNALKEIKSRARGYDDVVLDEIKAIADKALSKAE